MHNQNSIVDIHNHNASNWILDTYNWVINISHSIGYPQLRMKKGEYHDERVYSHWSFHTNPMSVCHVFPGVILTCFSVRGMIHVWYDVLVASSCACALHLSPFSADHVVLANSLWLQKIQAACCPSYVHTLKTSTMTCRTYFKGSLEWWDFVWMCWPQLKSLPSLRTPICQQIGHMLPLTTSCSVDAFIILFVAELIPVVLRMLLVEKSTSRNWKRFLAHSYSSVMLYSFRYFLFIFLITSSGYLYT